MSEQQVLFEVQKIAVFGTILAALIGGITGILGSLIITAINSQAEKKRQIMQLGFDMGFKQWENLFGHLSASIKSGTEGIIAPPYAYVNFNLQVLKLMYDGKLTPAKLEKVFNESKEMTDTINKHSKV